MSKSSFQSNIVDVPVRLPVGRAIKMRRTRLHLTQTEVAAQLGVNQSYLSRVETSPVHIGTDVLTRGLADILNADVDDLKTGRVPLSWFGAVLMDGVLVTNREDAVHALAVMEGLSDEAIEDVIATAKRATNQPERRAIAEALAEDDAQLLRVIDALQRMPRSEFYRLLRGIEKDTGRG